MKPYYSDDAVTIYHADALEWVGIDVPRWPIWVTDPPYGSGLYPTDTDVFSADLLSMMEGTGPTAVFGWPERLVAYCSLASLIPDEWITWWPTNGACRGFNMNGLVRESEHIAIFADDRGLTIPRVERGASSESVLAAGYNPTNRRIVMDNGQPGSRKAGDVWTDPAPGLAFNADKRLHPNEKPVTVLRRLLGCFHYDPDEVVVDPFCGSGTTLRAAKDLGLRAVGIEIEERYCEIAAKRMDQEVLNFGVSE